MSATDSTEHASSATTTISLRLTRDMLERIDHAAESRGETRSTYIMSWVPEFYGREAA